MFSFKWFTYFFAGFMICSLAATVIGVNITFWHTYTIDISETVSYSVDWYSIKRLDTSFWDTFKSLSKTYEYMWDFTGGIPRIPNIPMIPTFHTGGWFLVLDLLISVVNGLSGLINFIINTLNGIRDVIQTVSAFINAFAIWVANAGAGAVPIIY